MSSTNMARPYFRHKETLVIFDLIQDYNIEIHPAWNSTLRRFFDDGACQGLTWSKVVAKPLQVVLHIGTSNVPTR